MIVKDEEDNIERCLQSLSWADEIVVVDSGSVDATVEICERYGCRIIRTEWLGFGRTKRFAVESALNDWVLSIDADEVVTEGLMERITASVESGRFHAYRIKRNSFYLGRMIRYCGWRKDYPVRLFDRRYGNFNESEVHEKVVIDGEKGRIDDPLLHYTYPDIASHIDRINRYSTLGAQAAFRKGKRSSLTGSIVRGFLKFIKMYFTQLGILDGLSGLILSLNSGYGVFLKYFKLRELDKNNGRPGKG